MGCFCFGSSKNRRLPRRVPISPYHHQQHQIQEGDYECVVASEPTKKVDELTALVGGEKRPQTEQLEACGRKKKRVKFDLEVTTIELPAEEEVFSDFPGEEEEETLSSDSPTNHDGKVSCYPTGHRYHSCIGSDDEYEDADSKEMVDGDDSERANDGLSVRNKMLGQQNVTEQESSESLFSLSIDSRKHVYVADTDEKEVSSPMPVTSSEGKECRSGSLNQNARLGGQREKLVKAKATSQNKNQEKENQKGDVDFIFHTTFSPEPAPRLEKQIFCELTRNEVAVETSLSSWLSLSETTPKSKASCQSVVTSLSDRVKTPKSAEERPILGVLTLEDLQQLSASNSPIRSRGRSRSPDDTPIIGTIGSYWNHTGQTTDSNSRSPHEGMKSSKPSKEEQRTTPPQITFKERLETAL